MVPDHITYFCFQASEHDNTQSNAEDPPEIRTLSDFLDEGDLAAGLQAWLKLTNNSISGTDNEMCLTEDDRVDSV